MMISDLHAPPPLLGEWRDFAGLAALQDTLLPATLTAAAESPFYRKHRDGIPAGRAELADYPLTTKADLREAYPFGMLGGGPVQGGHLPRVQRHQRHADGVVLHRGRLGRPGRPVRPQCTSASGRPTPSWSGRRTR